MDYPVGLVRDKKRHQEVSRDFEQQPLIMSPSFRILAKEMSCSGTLSSWLDNHDWIF